MHVVRRARLIVGLLLAAAVVAAPAWSSPAHAPPARAHAAATCNDYKTQAAAQRAADTRDPDGDGLYCESLPCPCLTPGAGQPPRAPATPAPSQRRRQHPAAVQTISFSKTKYPHIRAHFRAALRKGWPPTLVLNRAGA